MRHGRPFACPQCSSAFGAQKDLDRYRETRHEHVAMFPCKVLGCPRMNRPFSRLDNLKRHVRTAHPGTVEILGNTPGPDQRKIDNKDGKWRNTGYVQAEEGVKEGNGQGVFQPRASGCSTKRQHDSLVETVLTEPGLKPGDARVKRAKTQQSSTSAPKDSKSPPNSWDAAAADTVVEIEQREQQHLAVDDDRDGLRRELDVLRNQIDNISVQRDELADEVKTLKASLKVPLQRVTSFEKLLEE